MFGVPRGHGMGAAVVALRNDMVNSGNSHILITCGKRFKSSGKLLIGLELPLVDSYAYAITAPRMYLYKNIVLLHFFVCRVPTNSRTRSSRGSIGTRTNWSWGLKASHANCLKPHFNTFFVRYVCVCGVCFLFVCG